MVLPNAKAVASGTGLMRKGTMDLGSRFLTFLEEPAIPVT